jgi:hypothetical protein
MSKQEADMALRNAHYDRVPPTWPEYTFIIVATAAIFIMITLMIRLAWNPSDVDRGAMISPVRQGGQVTSSDTMRIVSSTEYAATLSSARDQNNFLLSIFSVVSIVVVLIATGIGLFAWRMQARYNDVADQISRANVRLNHVDHFEKVVIPKFNDDFQTKYDELENLVKKYEQFLGESHELMVRMEKFKRDTDDKNLEKLLDVTLTPPP